MLLIFLVLHRGDRQICAAAQPKSKPREICKRVMFSLRLRLLPVMKRKNIRSTQECSLYFWCSTGEIDRFVLLRSPNPSRVKFAKE